MIWEMTVSIIRDILSLWPCLEDELRGGVGSAVPHAVHVGGERNNAVVPAESGLHRQPGADTRPLFSST